MPNSILGFAVVGTGMIAGYHAQAIAQTEGARLVGIVSRSPEHGAEFAARHGAPVVTTTVEEMVARPEVDALCITTPSGAHLAPALAAIRAGKHVVVEKPLEITPARVDEIVAAAERHRVKLAAIFQSRFGPGAQTLKHAIETGRFGRLVFAHAHVPWHRTAAYYETRWRGTWALDGGGALMNQAIHSVDLLQWFAGMPSEVFGRTSRRVHTRIEAEDTVVASLIFPNGAFGSIAATTAAWPGWSRRIEIVGERGSARLEDDRLVRWDFADPLPEDDTIRAASGENALGSGASTPGGIALTGHLRQIADFVEAVRSDRSPLIDGREGRNAVALVHAIYDSAKRGAVAML